MRISSDAGRISGQCQYVCNSESLASEQIGLDTHQIAVSCSEMNNCGDISLLFDQVAGSERRHADAGHRTVSDIYGICPDLFELLGGCQDLSCYRPFRWI